MRKILLMTLLGGLGMAMVPYLTAAEPEQPSSPAATTADVDQDSLITAVQTRIVGREELPAEEVFDSIEVLKSFPAGRVPMIMKFGFARSLGVDCTHCHDVQNLASEAKSQKQVARKMWELSGDINQQLAAIPNLESERPVVNCTTCHRGQKKPATNLD
jgi:hypothetical protein